MTQRTILFRGKSIESGEWVEGYFGIKGEGTDLEKSFIMQSEINTKFSGYPFYFADIEVDPATVGQFTGIERDGIKMFEGDLVSSNGRIWVVRYKQDKYHIGWIATDEKQLSYVHIWYDDMKVVGNIFDNPELLTK